MFYIQRDAMRKCICVSGHDIHIEVDNAAIELIINNADQSKLSKILCKI